MSTAGRPRDDRPPAIFPTENPGLSDATYGAMAFAAAVLFFISLLLHEVGHAVVGDTLTELVQTSLGRAIVRGDGGADGFLSLTDVQRLLELRRLTDTR